MTKDTKTLRLGSVPSASAARSGRGTGLRTRAAAVGIAVAIGTGTVLATVSATWLSSTIALALVMFAPTSARLDRRLALNLALAVGWAPAALLLPPVLGPRTAAVAILALASGAAAAVWLARRPASCPTAGPGISRWWSRASSPRSSRSPCAPPAAPARALAMLSTGIDHAFQFSMYLDRRLSAGLPAFAAGADNSGFSNYPKWFHSLLTVLAQVVFGEVGRPEAGAGAIRPARVAGLRRHRGAGHGGPPAGAPAGDHDGSSSSPGSS